MPVPKLQHFIWAGGEKLLPPDNVAHVKEWARKNPEFETILWVDKKTTPPELLEKYKTKYKFDEDPKIILKDINEEGVADEYSRYHIDHLEPNYGASSDILRYAILKKFGGVYLDSDILAGKLKLNHDHLFDNPDKTEVLKINQFTQNAEAIGNDGFICTPDHPFMTELYERAKMNHDEFTKSYYAKDKNIYLYNEFDMKVNWTVGCTGPGAVRQVCHARGMIPDFDDHGMVQTSNPDFMMDRSVYTPVARNEGNWMGLFVVAKNLDDAIASAIKSIHFEAKHMGCLLLDYHVKNIVESTNEDAQEVAARLVDALKLDPPDLSRTHTVQLLSKYQVIRDYYKQNTPNLDDNFLIQPTLEGFFKPTIEMLAMFSKEENIKMASDYAVHMRNLVSSINDSNPDSINLLHLNKLLMTTLIFKEIANPEYKQSSLMGELDQIIKQVVLKVIQNCLKKGDSLDNLMADMKELLALYSRNDPDPNASIIDVLKSAVNSSSEPVVQKSLSQLADGLVNAYMSSQLSAFVLKLSDNISERIPGLRELLEKAYRGAIEPQEFLVSLKKIAADYSKATDAQSRTIFSRETGLKSRQILQIINKSDSLGLMIESVNRLLSSESDSETLRPHY